MAQLPPKIPNMAPSWPEFSPHHHRHGGGGGHKMPSSWVDEFLDFSSARRSAHRRSVSDPVAYLDPPEDCRKAVAGNDNAAKNEFDDDEEQFLSMFADEVPSTASDHNSFNDQKQQQKQGSETEEVQSQCEQKQDEQQQGQRIVDPKRVKRILANRQSAQRSRVRKLQYISELERSVTSLQAEVSVLSPRVAFLDHQRLLLNVDNSALKQRIAALHQDNIFKDAHQEALKREIERLRQVYQQQNELKSMENPTEPQCEQNNLKNTTIKDPDESSA